MTVPQKRQGLLFVLIGPAGTGKNSLMNGVLSRIPDLKQLPTATTRPMRSTEMQGREHLFMDVPEFERMIDAGELVEWQQVHGVNYYGVPKSTVERAIANTQDLIADIEIYGASCLRFLYPDNTILIFIQPPSLDALEERMRGRGESESEIDVRMNRVHIEMDYAPLCDYLIINDDIVRATETLYGIVLAERSRRDLLNLRAASALPRHTFVYSAGVIPVFGDEVLVCRESPGFLTAQPAQGELPHETALRILSKTLAFRASVNHLVGSPGSGEFVSPLNFELIQRLHHLEIAFIYVYGLPERLSPPEGWHWISASQAGFSAMLTDSLLSAVEVQQAE